MLQLKLRLLLVSVGAAISPLSSTAQGIIYFQNLAGSANLDAPVYDIDGVTKLAGPAFAAQLYAAPPGGSLAAVGFPVSFKTGSGAGYFLGGAVIVPTVPAGVAAVLQVRAWRVSDGSSFEAANHPGGHVGMSGVLNIELGNDGPPPSPPVNLFGLQSFSLYVVPEPSFLALGLIASLAFGLRRWVRRR
ncbi:MAG: hypothetical protein ACYDH9_17760 [Limisphaerales bacterium]